MLNILNDKLLEVLDDKEINDKIVELNNQLNVLNNNLIKNAKEEKNLFNLLISGNFSKKMTDEKAIEIKNNKKFILDKSLNLTTQINELEKTKNDLLNIEKLRNNFKAGDKLYSDVISKIIKKITITQVTEFPEQFNKVKGDKVIEVKIDTLHNTRMNFFISQRTDFVFTYKNNRIIDVNKLFYISKLIEK